MRPWIRRSAAAGPGAWILLDTAKQSFQVGLAVIFSTDATATAKVQHTFDKIYEKSVNFTISRTTTTATVTKVNHGLVAGDWIRVAGAGAPFDGEFSVASAADADTFTYPVANSGATSGGQHKSLQSARVFDHDALAALSANADGNYAFPPTACRLNLTAYTDGFVELVVVQAG